MIDPLYFSETESAQHDPDMTSATFAQDVGLPFETPGHLACSTVVSVYEHLQSDHYLPNRTIGLHHFVRLAGLVE